MNPLLDGLHPYPFERLRILLAGLRPPTRVDPINLGIGEPQHATPRLITQAITENLGLLGKYPPTAGTPELRQAISNWLSKRYGIPAPDPDRGVIPVAGTREALFAFAQAALDPSGMPSGEKAVVLLPNPFYQIYEGAALLAGAEPFYVPTPAENSYLPDWSAVPPSVWPRVRLAFVCSPGNPTGAILGLDEWKSVFNLADRYGFVVAADECYSEIYNEEAPVGILEAAHRLGRNDERIVTFNSLSKRSSAPGLRSGFVAGDPSIIVKFLLYRTYHGAAPSLLTQVASVAAWSDEHHVESNREKYRAKFAGARQILPQARIPKGSFFLWHRCKDDEQLTLALFNRAGLTVLPGRYLARASNGDDPGANHVRIALVPEVDVCLTALARFGTIAEEYLCLS